MGAGSLAEGALLRGSENHHLNFAFLRDRSPYGRREPASANRQPHADKSWDILFATGAGSSGDAAALEPHRAVRRSASNAFLRLEKRATRCSAAWGAGACCGGGAISCRILATAKRQYRRALPLFFPAQES
jgi:hypothetical protein